MDEEGNLKFVESKDWAPVNSSDLDSFKRSLCPQCNSWKTWEIKGDTYTCSNCNAKYVFRNGILYSPKGTTVGQIWEVTKDFQQPANDTMAIQEKIYGSIASPESNIQHQNQTGQNENSTKKKDSMPFILQLFFFIIVVILASIFRQLIGW